MGWQDSVLRMANKLGLAVTEEVPVSSTQLYADGYSEGEGGYYGQDGEYYEGEPQPAYQQQPQYQQPQYQQQPQQPPQQGGWTQQEAPQHVTAKGYQQGYQPPRNPPRQEAPQGQPVQDGQVYYDPQYASQRPPQQSQQAGRQAPPPQGEAQAPAGQAPRKGEGQVQVVQVRRVEDAHEYIGALLSGFCLILNMEQVEGPVARRVLDQLSGAAFALRGALVPVAQRVFLLAPAGMKVTDQERSRGRSAGGDFVPAPRERMQR